MLLNSFILLFLTLLSVLAYKYIPFKALPCLSSFSLSSPTSIKIYGRCRASLVMLNMENGGEGISCVGKLIRKFESLCCDMDVVLRQELGHVEQHLQSFGAKVARICSNVDEEISQILEEEKESDIDTVDEEISQILDEEKESDIDTVDEEISEILDEEKESDIDMVDSDASNIGSINEDHYKNDSSDANNSRSSCSVQPLEKVENIESSVEQKIDSRTDENLGVTDEENHLAAKEEILASEGNLRDMLESDTWNHCMKEVKSSLKEYLSMGSLESDDDVIDCVFDIPMDDLTDVFQPERMLEDDKEMMKLKTDLVAKQKMETNRSFEEKISDDIGEATFGEIYDDIDEEQTSATLKSRKRKVATVPSEACCQLSKVAGHESKQAGHEFAVEVIQKSEEKSKESGINPESDCAEVIQKLEELTTNQDSDWVIV